jgi:hypothetical protein
MAVSEAPQLKSIDALLEPYHIESSKSVRSFEFLDGGAEVRMGAHYN